jgi:16S rRNA (cytosine967-C5)-methyltransferase
VNTPSPPSSPALSTQLLQAAQAVLAVRQGRSLTEALARCPAPLRPAAQALSFAVLRRLGSAEAARAHLVPKPPAPAVDALLLSALALLWPADPGEAAPYEDHTLVNQAVTAARQLQASSASFVNAVLRRFLRERGALVPTLLRQPVAQSNHPAWWIQQLKQDWPDHWQALLRANNRHAPMSLRVNARWGSAADYVARLAQAGLSGQVSAHPLLAHAVQLDHPVPVTQLPGFADGDISVQDLAAQQAAPLLLQACGGRAALPPGARVLDACAAPGGKTAHLAELAELDLWALDSDAERLKRVDETLQRLKLSARTVAADAAHTARWWDGQPFDAILLDAPCSASGIVRRHPDIRWLRRPDDLPALARTQAHLLRSLWPLLKPGGRLLYATCSVFRAEGPEVIDAFVGSQADARHDASVGGPLLPGLDDGDGDKGEQAGDPRLRSPGDGFYYAMLEKTPSDAD